MQPSRSKRALIAGLTLFVLNCDDWHVWDDLFARHPAAGAQAWTGGDGGLSAALPGDRNLWLFGDTLIGSVDANGSRTGSGAVLGNTIGLQSSASAPDPAQVRFFARSAGAPTDITDDGPGNYTAFFDHSTFKLTPPPPGLWGLWPQGSTCIDCADADASNDKLLVALGEIVLCNPQTDGSGCLPLCAPTSCTLDQSTCSNNCTPDPACTLGLRFNASILGIVTNPSATPDKWTVTQSPPPARILTDVMWGTAVLVEGSYIYIYGQNAPKQNKLFVARTTAANLLIPGRWEYRVRSAWLTLPSLPMANQLDTIADNLGPLASVTKVTRRGQTRYLLVHDHLENDHFLFVRASTTLYGFPAIDSLTPKADLSSIDVSLQWAQALDAILGVCPACVHNGESDYRACSQTYQGRAQPQLSVTDDGNGVSSLVFSYVVPHGYDGGHIDARYYRPKFGVIQLDNIAPWCTLAGQPCWEGIGHQYNSRPIAAGEDQTYIYDVSEAARLNKKLYATILGGTGDPDLYVRFASQGINACVSASPNTTENCTVQVPPGEKTAYVTVHGYAAGSFLLRTAYAGK